MDKPTTPGGLGGPKSSWPDDSGSDQDFGATGVFGAVKAPEPAKELPDSKPQPDFLAAWAAEDSKPQPVPQPPPAPTPVAEPVVHKVVFGGGAAASSPEILDRMRMASAERAPTPEAARAPESGNKSSEGFTGLLRTLGSESSAPAAKELPKPEPARAAADSGFTSLLRTLSASEPASAPAASPAPPPRSTSPASGGFTELLRVAPTANPTPMTDPRVEAPQTPVMGGAVPATPPPVGNQPGAFTQLFGTFGGAGATPSAPSPEIRNPAAPTAASAGSFTQMLSIEQRSAPVEPVYREESKPSAGGLDYGLPPATPRPEQATRDPFSSPPSTQPPPLESTPPGSGMGITRLIQMLDQPSTHPVPRVEPVPVSPPRGAEPGVWTQTFASLATPSGAAAPPARAPDWAPPQSTPAPPAYPVSREPQYPASVSASAMNPPAAAPSAAGPSEFTRILDASRMRELAMRGGAGAESLSAPPPPQNLPPAPQFAPPPLPPPPPPMPHYPIQAPPQPPAMQGMGGMPQPGGFPPPPPTYPTQFGPQSGAMPPHPGGMPHQPGMFAAPPPPPLPQVPPIKPPALAAAKTQQLLVIMGVVIIVLLVAILVTVIFLMKH
jgi:hypothetical protein